MSEPVAFARQATFNTEPADSISEGSIRRGSIELPVVDSDKVSTRLKPTDKNNNDNGCNDRNRFTTINDESDSDIEHGSQYTNNNTTTQRQNAPPSNQSSPIYGSKSAYEKFNKKYAPTRAKKPPSTVDDSSDLEILSDVGLADDSDCDVVPVITPLSLSARRKIRKEPRIKVPSAKIDNTEPTIQEETTQDILNVETADSKATNSQKANSVPRQIRSQTIVFEKRLETVPDEIVVVDKDISEKENINTVPPKKVFKQIDRTGKTNDKNAALTSAVRPVPLNKKKNSEGLQIVKDELESSFYESDWQPRNSDSDRISAAEDKKVIIKRHEREIKSDTNSVKEPLTAREPPANKLDSQDTRTNRPNSAGDKPKSKSVPGVATGNQSLKRTKINAFEKSAHLDKADNSRPQSRSVHTPVISNFLEEGRGTSVIESSAATKKNSTVYSGVPRRENDKQREVIPKNKIKPFLSPSKVANNSDNMATSDGYDYESETFEEILQDRNAMVKAERTYQKRIKQLEEELKGMINQCQALSDENKELRKTVDNLKKDKKTEQPETKAPDNSNEKSELVARIAALETEKENFSKLNEKLSLAAKEDNNKKKQSDVVFVENTKLKNKNSELDKKVLSLQNEIDFLKAKVKELSTGSSGKSAVLEFKNKEQEVALADLKYENKSLHSRVKSLENEKHMITNNLEEKRIEINEMMRAMQNETVTETELKQSKAKLDEAQGEINSVKNELEEMKSILKEAENKKGRLQTNLTQRESEIKRLRNEQESKDKVIVDLRVTTDKLRDEVFRHEENQHVYKDMERETAALKSRIASLKTEIESSLSENYRLKHEREEANQEIDRLRNENVATTDAVMESRRYFRKWETERDSRNKAEVEAAKKQDEINGLHASLKESGIKMNMLYGRLRAAEEERERFRGPNAQELETNNKILSDENKKLRQMLIEKNVELVQKTNEKEVLDNRIGILERKQKDSEVRVRQLSGWVDSIHSKETTSTDPHRTNKQSSNKNNPPRQSISNKNNSFNSIKPSPVKRSGVKEPIIAVISPRSRKKRIAPSTMTPPPTWEEKVKYHEDNGSNHTPLSLPLISETKPKTPTDFNSGYFQMYKERMKKIRDRYVE